MVIDSVSKMHREFVCLKMKEPTFENKNKVTFLFYVVIFITKFIVLNIKHFPNFPQLICPLRSNNS